MKTINALFQKLYRLSVGVDKHEEIVWRNLKALHSEADWRCGVYESDKCIETIFEIAPEMPAAYRYVVSDGKLVSIVEVGRWSSPEQTVEMFVLASHLNNILKSGTVTVDAHRLAIEYRIQSDLLVPVLYEGEVYGQLIRHYGTSKDLYWACSKLIHENEEPALIVADLLRKEQVEIETNS